MSDAFSVTVGGVKFRPCSAATLAWLVRLHSPLVYGGEFSPVDFIVFAWMHAAPIAEVEEHIKAGTYEDAAVHWGASVPPAVFAVYTPRKLQAFADDLSHAFADEKTGFIPFPYPSPSNARWSVRDWISTGRRFLTGSLRHSNASTR